MGLFAVIGPSINDQCGPWALRSRSLSKMRFSSQKRRSSRSIAGKSGTLGTGRYMFVEAGAEGKIDNSRKLILAHPAQLSVPGGLQLKKLGVLAPQPDQLLVRAFLENLAIV